MSRILRALAALALFATLAACVAPPPPGQAPTGQSPTGPAPTETRRPPPPDTAEARDRAFAQRKVRDFVTVVETVEPVAERLCRQRTPNVNCDFAIFVDDRPQPPNAFQTLDDNERPVLVFTLSLIGTVRNQDEMAFIMGHEAAHHIRGHLPRVQEQALVGAVLAGSLARVAGATDTVVNEAARYGAFANSRRFSKGFELEADELGTIISARAGYDPVRGAAYFTRISDPGNQFLGTHPPNAERIQTVIRTAQAIGAR